MRKSSYAAVAAAIAFSSSARAHEFVCEKTVNGDVVHEIKSYPEKLNFKVSVINTHPTDASTALSVRDDLMSSLGVTFAPAPPFTVAVGQSADFSFEVTVHDEAECLKLAQVQACGASFEDLFEVTWDGGSAQCAARLICGHETGGGAAVATSASTTPIAAPAASARTASAKTATTTTCASTTRNAARPRVQERQVPGPRRRPHVQVRRGLRPGDKCENGKCEDRDDHHMCKYDADCGHDGKCENGKCEDRDDHHMCKYDADCGHDGKCENGKCEDRVTDHHGDDGDHGHDGDHGGGDDHGHRNDYGGKEAER